MVDFRKRGRQLHTIDWERGARVLFDALRQSYAKLLLDQGDRLRNNHGAFKYRICGSIIGLISRIKPWRDNMALNKAGWSFDKK